MEEHKNREKHKWAEHGKVKYNDLINQLLLFIRMHIPEIKNVKSLKFVN